MKKTIYVFVYLLSMTVAAQKKAKKYSFYIQGGHKSSLYIKEAGRSVIVSETETQHHKCIIFNAGLLVNLSKKWRAGPAFTYDHFGTKHRSVEYSTLSYLLRCDHTWKETKKYSLYSGLSLGVRKIRRFEEEKEMEHLVKLGYQVYGVGINYKVANRVFFDMNVGWGVSGIVSAGGKFQF